MKQAAILILVLATVFTLTSCKKNKTVDVKLHVQSEITGMPIANARVELAYYEGKKSKGDAKTIALGITDASGNLSATDMIKGKSYDHEVVVYANGYGKVTADYLAVKFPYEPGNKMDQTAKIRPVYHYLIKMTNVNYQSPSDSAWVTGPNNLSGLATGNTPKTIYYGDVPSFGCSNWIYLPQVTLQLKVRRGTSVSETSTTYPLTEGQITTVNVDF